MWIATCIWGGIALLLLLDALRIHSRMRGVHVLSGTPSGAPLETHQWVRAPGVVLTPSVQDQTAAHLQSAQLGAVDVLPGAASLSLAWSLGCHVDPPAQAKDPHRPGDTGAHAFLAPKDVLEGLNVTDCAPDMATFISWSREVRRRVSAPYGFVIAPELEGHEKNPFFDPQVLRIRLGGSVAPVVAGIPFVWSLLALGVVLSPIAGVVAILCYLLQQPLAFLGTGFRPRMSWVQGLLRGLSDFVQWLSLLGATRDLSQQIEALRPKYDEALSQGTARFFHPMVKQCPICGSAELRTRFSLPDLYQGKPGRFHISQCNHCQHHFQNPQLNPEGLNFYYADFYDGLGEDSMDAIFGATKTLYADRINMVKAARVPKRWLDVGCGHGHLFSHVRHALPDTRLEGLDIGDGVEAGLARGWMDKVHRGFFTEVCDGLRDTYDVVSMCHYLEHTIDPRAEIAAANMVLQEQGLLLIEVPDPESPFIPFLGKYWMPWFQPQHLHFIRTAQLSTLLYDAGFEPLEWHTGKANTGNDFTLSIYGFMSGIAPSLHVPWRPKPNLFERLRHMVVWGPGLVFIAMGILLDKLCGPIVRGLPHSGQYRVLARKVS